VWEFKIGLDEQPTEVVPRGATLVCPCYKMKTEM